MCKIDKAEAMNVSEYIVASDVKVIEERAFKGFKKLLA